MRKFYITQAGTFQVSDIACNLSHIIINGGTTGNVSLYDGPVSAENLFAVITAAVGMVMQETYLFHDTIRANLLYAMPGASEEELRHFVAQKLAAFKVPVKILFLPETLPRNANGKIMKKDLKGLFA